MKQQKKNYHLTFALFTSVACAILYGLTVSGQTYLYLERLPSGNLGLMRNVTADEIVTFELTQNITNIDLPMAGDYRVISSYERLHADHLTVYSKVQAEEIPLTIIDQTKFAPYETDLLQGNILFDFHIDQPGTYELHVDTLDLNEVNPTVTIFPDYRGQNRQRVFLSMAFLLIAVIVAWFVLSRPTLSKEQRQVKKDKWDTFMKEKDS